MDVFTIAPANVRVLWLVGLVPLVVLVIVIGVLVGEYQRRANGALRVVHRKGFGCAAIGTAA